MTDSLIRELTTAEIHADKQIGVYKLARESFWRRFDETLKPLVESCEDLAHHYCAQLWDQYKEGLITASEFLNKLMDEMQATGSTFMPPIDRWAAEGLHLRVDDACRKFAKVVVSLGDQLAEEGRNGVPIRPGSTAPSTDVWRNPWNAKQQPYLYCHAIGSRLCDLDKPRWLA